MEIEKYADWTLRFQERALAERVPISGSIEVTQRCNLGCVHCYNNLAAGDQKAQRNELSCEQHCRLLDQIAEAGCLWLLYTGGEIFVRKDFLEIYTYAKKKGLLLTLFTNGTPITPAIADYLAEWRPFAIEVTFYGRTRETHERVTGIPGSYDRCMRAIRLLKERSLPLMLKTMVMSLNKHEIWDMKRFVEEELGLEFRFDAMLNPRIDCSPVLLTVRLSPQEVIALDLQDPARKREWRRFCEHMRGPFPDLRVDNGLYQCGGGLSAFAIDPLGMLSTCVLWPGDTYDLPKGSFREGWEQFLLELSHKKITRQTKCVACELKSMCSMCPANAELESGDAESPVDFLCEVAHLRAYALGLEVAPHGECEYCKGGEEYEVIMEKVKALLSHSG